MRLVASTEQDKSRSAEAKELMDSFLVTAFNYSATKKHSVLQVMLPIKFPISAEKLRILQSTFKEVYADEIESEDDVVIISISYLGEMIWNKTRASN